MRRRALLGATLVSAMLLVGCTGRDAGSVAGGIVVDSKPAVTIAGWRPDGTLGAGDIADAIRLSNGNIVVADSRFAQLRRFDAEGHSLKTHPGTAPAATFAQVSWIGRCGGDSIYVWDGVQRRVSVLSDTLAFVRSFSVPANIWEMSCNAAGALALITTPKKGSLIPSAQATEGYSTILLMSAKGDTIATIEQVPAGINRPMGPITSIRRTPNGVLIGTGDAAAIELFSDSGRRVGPLPIPMPIRAMTAADYQAAIDSLYLASVSPGPQRDRLHAALAAIPMPLSPPKFRELFADPTGNAWVLVSWPLDSAVVLRGVAPGGAPLGELMLPKSVTVLEVGGDYVLGRSGNTTGTQVLQLFRFHTPK